MFPRLMLRRRQIFPALARSTAANTRLAHITNRMAAIEGDFEKGESSGSVVSLRLISAVAEYWNKNQALRKEPRRTRK
jgi:hypothetical protein